jgi:predicted nucleic acid-binding protein
MIFADLPGGASVFVDANTLVYHFQPHPVFGPACTDLVERIDLAGPVSQHTGLLTNDALVVAVMQANGLTNLASNDADFDRASRLRRYAPA